MPDHNTVTRSDVNNHPPGPLTDYLDGAEQTSDPSAPAASHRALYAKADGWYDEDHAGTVTPLVPGVEGGYAPLDSGILVPIAYLPGVEALATAEMDTAKVLAPDGAGGVEFRAEAGGGGGSSYPTGSASVVQAVGSASSNVSSFSITVSAPTSGNVLILGVGAAGSASVKGVSQTNVEWSQLIAGRESGDYASIWIGFASASAGTSITVTLNTTVYCGGRVIEVSGIDGRAVFATCGFQPLPNGTAIAPAPAPFVGAGTVLFYIGKEDNGTTALGDVVSGPTTIGALNDIYGAYNIGQPSGTRIGPTTGYNNSGNKYGWAMAVIA